MPKPLPTTVTATIAAGSSLSDAADLSAGTMYYLIAPDDWDAADLSFQVSEDNVTFYDLFDNKGYEVTRLVVTGAAVNTDPTWTQAAMWLKLRSGPRVSPVAQDADRVFKLVLVP